MLVEEEYILDEHQATRLCNGREEAMENSRSLKRMKGFCGG